MVLVLWSSVRPLGQSMLEVTKMRRLDPSIQAFSIRPMLSFTSSSSQSVQYIQLPQTQNFDHKQILTAFAWLHHPHKLKAGASLIKKLLNLKIIKTCLTASEGTHSKFSVGWNVICSIIWHDLFYIKHAQGMCYVWGLLTEPRCSRILINDRGSAKGGWNRMRYGGEWSLPLSFWWPHVLFSHSEHAQNRADTRIHR